MRAALLGFVSLLLVRAAPAAEPVIRWVDFDATILPVISNRIVDAIDDADREGDDLIVIRLDTPGGMLSTTNDVVQKILGAKTPVVVWVGPSGAQAASAGFHLLEAADVAAMAPGTRTGAASVIYGFGKSDENDVALKKATNDSAAALRSIAERRGRNVAASEKAVLEAASYTDSDALAQHLIDLVAKDREDLLAQLDGREVKRLDGSTVVARTKGARFVSTETSLRQRVLEIVGSQYVAFLLLLVGLGGLYIELTHPGVVLPGVVGALCLLLFALAAQILPVSTVGLLLIALGIAMFVLEIKVTSYGMLAFGGIACFVIGSIMLFPGPNPELRLPLTVAIPPALALGGLCAFAVRLAVRAQRTAVGTGVEGLVGELGEVTRDLEPEGRVFVHGEIWNAVVTSGAAARGSRVRVVRVEDMKLTVEPVPQARAGGGNA